MNMRHALLYEMLDIGPIFNLASSRMRPDISLMGIPSPMSFCNKCSIFELFSRNYSPPSNLTELLQSTLSPISYGESINKEWRGIFNPVPIDSSGDVSLGGIRVIPNLNPIVEKEVASHEVGHAIDHSFNRYYENRYANADFDLARSDQLVTGEHRAEAFKQYLRSNIGDETARRIEAAKAGVSYWKRYENEYVKDYNLPDVANMEAIFGSYEQDILNWFDRLDSIGYLDGLKGRSGILDSDTLDIAAGSFFEEVDPSQFTREQIDAAKAKVTRFLDSKSRDKHQVEPKPTNKNPAPMTAEGDFTTYYVQNTDLADVAYAELHPEKIKAIQEALIGGSGAAFGSPGMGKTNSIVDTISSVGSRIVKGLTAPVSKIIATGALALGMLSSGGIADAKNLNHLDLPQSPQFAKVLEIAKEYNRTINKGYANYVVADKPSGFIHVYSGITDKRIYSARALYGTSVGDKEYGPIQYIPGSRVNPYRIVSTPTTTPAKLFTIKQTQYEKGTNYDEAFGGFNLFGNEGEGLHGEDSARANKRLKDINTKGDYYKKTKYTRAGRRLDRIGTFGCISVLDEDNIAIRNFTTQSLLPQHIVDLSIIDFHTLTNKAPSTIAVVPDYPENVKGLERQLELEKSIKLGHDVPVRQSSTPPDYRNVSSHSPPSTYITASTHSPVQLPTNETMIPNVFFPIINRRNNIGSTGGTESLPPSPPPPPPSQGINLRRPERKRRETAKPDTTADIQKTEELVEAVSGKGEVGASNVHGVNEARGINLTRNRKPTTRLVPTAHEDAEKIANTANAANVTTSEIKPNKPITQPPSDPYWDSMLSDAEEMHSKYDLSGNEDVDLNKVSPKPASTGGTTKSKTIGPDVSRAEDVEKATKLAGDASGKRQEEVKISSKKADPSGERIEQERVKVESVDNGLSSSAKGLSESEILASQKALRHKTYKVALEALQKEEAAPGTYFSSLVDVHRHTIEWMHDKYGFNDPELVKIREAVYGTPANDHHSSTEDMAKKERDLSKKASSASVSPEPATTGNNTDNIVNPHATAPNVNPQQDINNAERVASGEQHTVNPDIPSSQGAKSASQHAASDSANASKEAIILNPEDYNKINKLRDIRRRRDSIDVGFGSGLAEEAAYQELNDEFISASSGLSGSFASLASNDHPINYRTLISKEKAARVGIVKKHIESNIPVSAEELWKNTDYTSESLSEISETIQAEQELREQLTKSFQVQNPDEAWDLYDGSASSLARIKKAERAAAAAEAEVESIMQLARATSGKGELEEALHGMNLGIASGTLSSTDAMHEYANVINAARDSGIFSKDDYDAIDQVIDPIFPNINNYATNQRSIHRAETKPVVETASHVTPVNQNASVNAESHGLKAVKKDSLRFNLGVGAALGSAMGFAIAGSHNLINEDEDEEWSKSKGSIMGAFVGAAANSRGHVTRMTSSMTSGKARQSSQAYKLLSNIFRSL